MFGWWVVETHRNHNSRPLYGQQLDTFLKPSVYLMFFHRPKRKKTMKVYFYKCYKFTAVSPFRTGYLKFWIFCVHLLREEHIGKYCDRNINMDQHILPSYVIDS